MVSAYTPNLRLTLQGDNDNPNTWGQVTNQQVIDLVEEALAGVATIDCTGSSDVHIDTTVVNGGSDTARHMVLELTGTIGANINFILPAVSKLYIIRANFTGAYTITVKPVGGSSGVVFTNTDISALYTNGTNIYPVSVNTAAFLQTANNLSDLSSPSTARANLGLGSMATQNSNNVNITGGTITGVTGISGSVTSVAGRTGDVVLSSSDISGLGTIVSQNSNNVNITGGTITGVAGIGVVTAGTNGKMVFGGVTIQWGSSPSGSGSTRSISFGTAFSSTPYYVNFELDAAFTNFPIGTSSVGNTGFVANINGSFSGNLRWIAIGPT